MNDHRRFATRHLVAEPKETEESRKLLAEEMERLGAPTAQDAARRFDARHAAREESALSRLFTRRR